MNVPLSSLAELFQSVCSSCEGQIIATRTEICRATAIAFEIVIQLRRDIGFQTPVTHDWIWSDSLHEPQYVAIFALDFLHLSFDIQWRHLESDEFYLTLCNAFIKFLVLSLELLSLQSNSFSLIVKHINLCVISRRLQLLTGSCIVLCLLKFIFKGFFLVSELWADHLNHTFALRAFIFASLFLFFQLLKFFI